MSLNDLNLTDHERRFLAMHARYESQKQEDFRYWDHDPIRRQQLLTRWRKIADVLHPDPWGDGNDD